MLMTTTDLKPPTNHRLTRKIVGKKLLAFALILAAGCGHSNRSGDSAASKSAGAKSEEGKTAGIRVVHPERRDLRMTVVQPGTIEAFETAPVYSRIAGYVEKYNYNIGDRVKAGDVLVDMWIPDVVQELAQRSAAVKRA